MLGSRGCPNRPRGYIECFSNLKTYQQQHASTFICVVCAFPPADLTIRINTYLALQSLCHLFLDCLLLTFLGRATGRVNKYLEIVGYNKSCKTYVTHLVVNHNSRLLVCWVGIKHLLTISCLSLGTFICHHEHPCHDTFICRHFGSSTQPV